MTTILLKGGNLILQAIAWGFILLVLALVAFCAIAFWMSWVYEDVEIFDPYDERLGL